MTALPACLAALAALSQCDCGPVGRSASPLLYVRLAGPAGSKVTLYQGRSVPRTFPSGTVVGFRPGYAYRVKISDIPGRNGMTLFPTIEVGDTLHLPPKLKPSDHPATLAVTQDDIDAVQNGTLVNKLLYLEHPDLAEPIATKPGEVLQTNYPPGSDLFREARKRGRPVLLMHMGERDATPDELAHENVPGTILFPGDRVIGCPARPPCIMQGCFQRATEEECFHDGGDRGRKAAIDGCGGLYGLDPEDTVATFRDSRGNKSVVCSNQVCICVPRFLALRSECPLSKEEGTVAPAGTQEAFRQSLVAQRKPPQQVARTDVLRAYDARLRPTVDVSNTPPGVLVGLKVLEATQVDLGLAEVLGTDRVQILTPVQKLKLMKQVELARSFTGSKRTAVADQVTVTAVVGRVEGGPEVVIGEASTRDLTVCCNEVPAVPEKPLFLVKCADRQSANIGDVITFSLRYSNLGGRAITDVAVSDSLSGRLEYVQGSAQSDRAAVFTMQQNEAGSLVLRWEITGKLLPGQTGRIRFSARVR